MKTIVVIVKGGVVQEVRGADESTIVEILDYDIDANDGANIHPDSRGNLFYLATYGGPDGMQSAPLADQLFVAAITAIHAASKIVTQHNLLSDGPYFVRPDLQRDRIETLQRLFSWLNGPRLAVLNMESELKNQPGNCDPPALPFVPLYDMQQAAALGAIFGYPSLTKSN